MKEIPSPILEKIAAIGGIGLCCFLFSFAYYLICRDKILCILGTAVFAARLCRAGGFLWLGRKGKYRVITGECVEIQYRMLGKIKLCRVRSKDREYVLQLPKKLRVYTGQNYSFYFSESSNAQEYGIGSFIGIMQINRR